MNGRIVLGILIALVLIAGAIGIGAYAYNYGVVQGMSDSGKLVAPAPGVMPYPYYYGPFGFHRPFGFGLSFLGCLVPLLFIFLFFGLLRRAFWGWGPRRWGGPYGHGGQGHVPSMFDEWHRQAHASQGSAPQPGAGEPKV